MNNTTTNSNSYAATITVKVAALESSAEYLQAERLVRAANEKVRDLSYAYDCASAKNDAASLAEARRLIVLGWIEAARAWNNQAAICRAAGFNYSNYDTRNLNSKASLWNLADLVPADLR